MNIREKGGEKGRGIREWSFFCQLVPVAVNRISPSAGPQYGDTVVSVEGTNFLDGPALQCQFGAQKVSVSFSTWILNLLIVWLGYCHTAISIRAHLHCPKAPSYHHSVTSIRCAIFGGSLSNGTCHVLWWRQWFHDTYLQPCLQSHQVTTSPVEHDENPRLFKQQQWCLFWTETSLWSSGSTWMSCLKARQHTES